MLLMLEQMQQWAVYLALLVLALISGVNDG
jgi:hypothetical protein